MKKRFEIIMDGLRLIPAGALIVSGVFHAVQPIRFALSILSYLAVPAWFLFVFTAFFPYAMIALGVAMAVSRHLSVYILATVVFAVF